MFKVIGSIALFIFMLSLSACSLEASLENLSPSTVVEAIRHDKDFSGTEVTVSGQYQIHGQIAETAERNISGNYIVEGVIAYE